MNEAGHTKSQHAIELLVFTDPVCTWCWGSEPILKKLELAYGAALSIRTIMGGMVRDMRDFEDTANGIGGNMTQVNAQIAAHWLEASRIHGMPVQTEGFALFSDAQPSSWPLNMAYKAACFENQNKALRLLRRIREAVATEALAANTLANLKPLALECGLDGQAFEKHMLDGSAEREFQKDRALCREYGVQVFPSYILLVANALPKRLEGYVRYAEFVRQITQISGGVLKAQLPLTSPELLISYVRSEGRLAENELMQIFELDRHLWRRLIEPLLAEGRLRRRPVGNGHWIEAV